MAEVRLNASPRTEFGKGGARRTRRAGLIPAVIYGHGADPRHVSLPERDFTNALKKGGSNVLLTLEVDGKDELAIPKAIQRDPIRGTYRHIDLLTVRRGEKITIDVRLQLVGEVTRGGLLAQESTSVSPRGRGDPHPDRDRDRHLRTRARHPGQGVRPRLADR